MNYVKFLKKTPKHKKGTICKWNESTKKIVNQLKFKVNEDYLLGNTNAEIEKKEVNLKSVTNTTKKEVK